MYCSKCGKEIPDNTTFCPECGARQAISSNNNMTVEDPSVVGSGNQVWKKDSYNILAIIGLVVSGISMALDEDMGFVIGIGGLVVSILGLLQCRKTGEKGNVLAIIGIVLGAISILYPFM